tara:strand:- start:2887 stop:3369 length:483 start_codon:yes stop_codon:yes gene_type:complete
METVIEKIYERHNEWVFMVSKYGCNKDTAEDIVQEMYIRLLVYLRKTGADITYKDDINIYFVAKTLKSIFLDTIRKEARRPETTYEEKYCEWVVDEDINFEDAYVKVLQSLENMYWFDKKIFDIIESGVKISELSDKTTIPYYTIYNTYKKVKKELKDKL